MQSSAVCFHFPTLFLSFPSDFLCFSLCPGIAGICFVCENEIPGGIALGATGECLGGNSPMEQAALGNPQTVKEELGAQAWQVQRGVVIKTKS